MTQLLFVHLKYAILLFCHEAEVIKNNQVGVNWI